MKLTLTDRQQRELDYHREHAKLYSHILDKPMSYDVLEDPGRRWWNAYWQMYAYLLKCNLKNKNVLIVGCGFGGDALRLAKLGANVSAFDLSPDSLQLARALAARESLHIDFREMPAESMEYPDSTFDYILARDILHHVDIPSTIKEIARVARPGALFVVNEIYSHSLTDTIRRSTLVEKIIYPRLRKFIYGAENPYITEDERKLTEIDVRLIWGALGRPKYARHFNFVVTRLLPARFSILAKVDQLLLRAVRPIGLLLAGRVLFSVRVNK